MTSLVRNDPYNTSIAAFQNYISANSIDSDNIKQPMIGLVTVFAFLEPF